MTFQSHDLRHAASAAIAAERIKLRLLKASIMERIDEDLRRVDRMIRALDLMDRDPDLEPDVDDEDGHDAEGHTDDNGIADKYGLAEQLQRAAGIEAVREAEFAARSADRARRGFKLVQGGRA